MLDTIRRIKGIYSIYNLFHKRELVHNERIYRKLGIHKRYYSSVSSRDFRNLPIPKSDSPDFEKQLKASLLFSKLDTAARDSLLDFPSQGFSVIRNYLSGGMVDAVNAEVENLIISKSVRFNKANKIMFGIHASKLLWEIGNDEELKQVLSILMSGNATLFQSINFLMGSEQATHSDSIHMTTYPEGGLLGVWIALEDITDENGPLHYYPGSHLLPYYLNADYENEGNRFLLGNKSYAEYEEMIAEKIKQKGLEKIKFLAQKGDLLIWHANLFHGGEPHLDKTKTRKSMVLHYFNEDAICYHEITQRPALLKNFG
ncbi:MAG: phytanoyl-CoA dioxygenase [Bacteroidetes bacterium]|nr:MAG: phytanoyl-CoA dioxygenase [Bacteroidota bacterium]